MILNILIYYILLYFTKITGKMFNSLYNQTEYYILNEYDKLIYRLGLILINSLLFLSIFIYLLPVFREISFFNIHWIICLFLLSLLKYFIIFFFKKISKIF